MTEDYELCGRSCSDEWNKTIHSHRLLSRISKQSMSYSFSIHIIQYSAEGDYGTMNNTYITECNEDYASPASINNTSYCFWILIWWRLHLIDSMKDTHENWNIIRHSHTYTHTSYIRTAQHLTMHKKCWNILLVRQSSSTSAGWPTTTVKACECDQRQFSSVFILRKNKDTFLFITDKWYKRETWYFSVGLARSLVQASDKRPSC